jgi:hypothetical protein
MKHLKHIILLLFVFCFSAAQAQMKNKSKSKLVELTGVVMSADSLRYIPFVIVNDISGKDGTVANAQGVFTLYYTPETQ